MSENILKVNLAFTNSATAYVFIDKIVSLRDRQDQGHKFCQMQLQGAKSIDISHTAEEIVKLIDEMR